MSSNSIDSLREYIRRIQRRRRLLLTLREIGLGVACIGALFAVLGYLEMRYQLPPTGRIALTLILMAAGGAFVWRYIHIRRRMSSDEQHIAHYVDERLPELEQRLITSVEFGEKSPTGESAVLVERLWEDTLVRFRNLDLTGVASIRAAWPAAATALVVFLGLFFAFRTVNEFSLAGMRILMPWTRTQDTGSLPVGLTVEPGTIKIQRGNDVMLVARIANTAPERVDLYLQTDSVNWRRVPMKKEGTENAYVHFLAAVKNDTLYYIDIGVKRSEKHRISVFEMPRLDRIDLDYVYPEYTGMRNRTVKDGGDVIAPEGTRITLHAAFNKAVAGGKVHFSDGTTIDLAVHGTKGTRASGSFIVNKDLTYMVKVIDHEQMENDDPYQYFVQSVPDVPPAVTLVRPGRDRQVMSLEEVFIEAVAEDDYGLAKFGLTYMVASSERREIDFLAAREDPSHVSIPGKTTLYLEDLEVNPGDFVFYYLSARDNNRLKGSAEVFSDIYFLEVVPTEKSFRRAPQQAGGGGGSGGRGGTSSALVENQKNIIAATWKLLKMQKEISPAKVEEDVQIIIDSQQQVIQRAQMSLRRLSERLLFSDDSYQRAVKHLEQAVRQMEAAIDKLTSRHLEDALGPEQSALQEIMKAEAESRNVMIQTARSRGGGGGASQASREREDLMELFEMEMGRLENRYEIPKRTPGARQESEQDNTLEKLQDLARRQERLNRGQKDLARRQDRMSAEQRKRRLEELRREQEELRKEAEDLSRRMSRLARQGGFRQWSDRQRRIEDAARQMQEAERSLRRQDTGNALSRGRQASEQLRGQENEMRRDRQATVSNLVDALKSKAQVLEQQEQRILELLQALQKGKNSESQTPGPETFRQIEAVLADKKKMEDELADTGDMLENIGKTGRVDQPEIAERAMETLRTLKTEGLADRIEESRRMLEAGWLSIAMDVENKIDQSVDRVSKQLRKLDRPTAPSRDEQIRQAAADAERLRQELENLQKDILALNNQRGSQKQRNLSGTDSPPEGQVKGTPGAEVGNARERMEQRLQRSRRYVRGLVQPWARGERWGIDARSIQRELTQKEIEDFLTQPDLWHKLLDPVRELESTLRAEANDRRLEKKIFSVPQEHLPDQYREQVEEYYRELSRNR